MSAEELAPQEPLARPPAGQPPTPLVGAGSVPIAAEHTAMFFLANPGKMVTLLAFYSLGERAATSYRLSQRIGEMQNGAPGMWQPHTNVIESYCEDAFFPANLIEYAAQNVPKRGSAESKAAMRLNEKGLTLGMGIVGALARVEFQTLAQTEDDPNKRLPVHVAMGRTMLTTRGVQGAPTKFAVFESLLDNPSGVAHGELQIRANIAGSVTVKLLEHLMSLNLITKHQDFGGNRPFRLLPELGKRDKIGTRTPESKTIVETLVRLQAAGIVQLTREEIVSHVVAARPDLDRQEVDTVLTRWCFKHPTLIEPANTLSELVRYTLNDEYRAFIGELVEVKRKLVDPSPEAKAWRSESWQYAVSLTRRNESNARKIAALMNSLRSYSAHGDESKAPD